MTTQTILASVLHGPKQLTISNREITSPAPGELQISIKATGLCGSDLHYYNHHRNGDILVREPLSLGHESAGVVESIGEGVKGFTVGDRVAIEVGIPCGNCKLCNEGRYNICSKMSFRSSAKSFPHFQGTLQERINHPAVWCHRLPENVSLDAGALLEPLSVAIHATKRSRTEPGDTCLVLGAGAVGILTASMLMVKGAKTIVIADIEPRRVAFALQNGFADRGVVLPRGRATTIDDKLKLAREAAELIGKEPHSGTEEAIGEYDAVFECTGVEPCVQTAIYAARPGGKVLLIGMGTPIQTLPVSAAALREVDLIGVFRYATTYEYGISLMSSAKREETPEVGRKLPDLEKLITHRYKSIQEATAAFEMAGKPSDESGNLVMKVFIEG